MRQRCAFWNVWFPSHCLSRLWLRLCWWSWPAWWHCGWRSKPQIKFWPILTFFYSEISRIGIQSAARADGSIWGSWREILFMAQEKVSSTSTCTNHFNREGVYLSPKIGLWDYRPRNQGRGLIALDTIDVSSREEIIWPYRKMNFSSQFQRPLFFRLKLRNSKIYSLNYKRLMSGWAWSSLCCMRTHRKNLLGETISVAFWWGCWTKGQDILPETFDTPMFWTDEELAELKGTETLPRIGKESAEERYTSILLPVITSHLDLFDISKCDLTAFHRMGSLVMAYSFGRDSEDDDDNSEEEEKNDIAMVPLADILNADPRLNNVSKSWDRNWHVGEIVSRWNRLGNAIYQTNS